MKEIVLRVENLSKQYRLGQVGTGTLSHDINRWWHRIRGKEDPYLNIGEVNDRSTTASGNYVWALKDINFDTYKGEVLGVIGKNGAGKSTLLKLISQITSPSKGSIKASGKIASLLEVGTGMHPEMTGRENIFLNGAILGMSKKEVNSKLDEIVEFSGVKKYLDTPVKRYSSGMKVRLGFAVAAHLEPEILIVDEVLAVGDADFQKRCIGKINEVSKKGGRTVLFVSHNMASIMELCDRALVMENGQVKAIGKVSDMIPLYLNGFKAEKITNNLSLVKNRFGNGKVRFSELTMTDEVDNEINSVLSGQKLKFKLKCQLIDPDFTGKLHVSLKFVDENDTGLFHLSNTIGNGFEFDIDKSKDTFLVECEIDKLPLNVGSYNFHLYMSNKVEVFDDIMFGGVLKVEGGNFYPSGKLPSKSNSILLVPNTWKIEYL